MLRGLTIFTALLGVILLGVLVALQVQSSWDEESATGAEIEAGEEDLSNEEVDFGESELLGPEEPLDALQTEPDPTVDPQPTTSLDAVPPNSFTDFDSDGPPSLDSPPRSLSADSTALPVSPGPTSPLPTASASSLPALAPVGIDPIRPLGSTTSFPAPPALGLPASDPAPPAAAAADPGGPGVATLPPPAFSAAAPPRSINPAAADVSVPPASEPVPPAADSRVIDLPQPPALSGSDFPEKPAPITPGAARPAPGTTAKADPLIGIGTIDRQAPQGLQQPQLQITKTFPAAGAIGEALIYTIRIRNAGLTTAHDVVLEDPIPQGAKLTGTVPQAELDSGRLSWSLGTMQPGSEHKILVRVVPTRAGDLGSTATVRFASRAAATIRIAGPGTAPSATVAPAPAAVGKIIKTGVSLDVTAPAEAEVGDVLTLTFTLTNHTQQPRSGIVLHNKIPEQLGHPAGADLEYPLPTLAAGGSKVITLKVTAKSKGRAINRATLASGQTLIASDQDTIRIGSPQPLKLEQSFPAQASVGSSITLKTVVTNTAATPSQAVTVQQTLAPGLDFLSASDNGQYDPVNGRIVWQLASLQPGARATFSTTVRCRQVGKKLTSLVRLTSGALTLATSSESLHAVGLAAPSMDITGVQAPAATGRDFDITYRLSNRGSAAVTGGQLRISLPATLELIKVTGGTRAVGDKSANLVITPKTATITGGDTQVIVITLRAANVGQHLLQSSFFCKELKQPLARTDAITTLPGVLGP